MRDHFLSPREGGGALVEVGGTPILISPDSSMQEPPAVTLK